MRNNDLTPFMFKKSGFILRLCWQSLSGQCFVTRKKSEKNDRWVVSPLIKSWADLALVSRPSIWISARLSTQSRIFYFPLQAVESEACAKIVPSLDSPRRVVPRTILPTFGALSGPNSPFSSWLVNWHFWTQSRNLRCFYENYHVLKNSAILRFHFSWPRKTGLPSKMP